MINYTNTLREHKLKVTPQRIAIVDALFLNGHMSTESLYSKMQEKFSSISLATIYKNINLMLENCLIYEVKLPHAKSVYELTKSFHSHLLCKKCGSIEDITVDLETLVDKISKITEFQIDKTDFILSGNCKNCHTF